VTIISVTVVAAFISAGGLGSLIFTGISNNHTAKIWTGALTVCALAVVVDILLALAERKLRRRYAA
jgi:osmoprotectant transport system permease protein